MGGTSSQCRSQYPRPSTCCAAGGSGEVKWRPINISIKDKHFRVRQLLKEDAGSGVRADDSGVGVFIIFINIMTLASSPTNTIVIIIISILTMTMTKVTPLHWAAINDRPDVVDLLLDCGADPNCKGSLLVLIVNQLGVESTVDYQYRPPSSLWTNPASQVEDLEGLHCTGRLQEGQLELR